MRREESQIGLVEIGNPDGTVTSIPSYVCGHCSDVVGLNPSRERPRRKCKRCGALICEMNQVCTTECIPVHDIARDHFEGELGLRASAVLSGIRTTAGVDNFVQAHS